MVTLLEVLTLDVLIGRRLTRLFVEYFELPEFELPELELPELLPVGEGVYMADSVTGEYGLYGSYVYSGSSVP